MDGGTRPVDDLDSGAPGSPISPSDAGVGADSGTPKTVSCPATTTPASSGETRATLQHDGRMRAYVTYIPSGYDPARPWPLVLNFHGATMTAEQQRDFSGMNAAADAKGFVVVYPQGVGNSWNAGACCGEAQTSNVDDVGFVRELIAAVQASVCIDPDRVYASGFSNGGRMTYRLGCELTDTFAALASVAGTKSFPDDQNSPGCKPTKPISMIDFMGSADPRSAAQPGQIAEWTAFNGCTDAMPMESYRQGQHVCTTYSQCSDATSVTACTVDGGDHCWPGSYPCLLGNTSRPEELSANELIWKLFERSVR
jgi:polyhydroxybutyrate depolymerase